MNLSSITPPLSINNATKFSKVTLKQDKNVDFKGVESKNILNAMDLHSASNKARVSFCGLNNNQDSEEQRIYSYKELNPISAMFAKLPDPRIKLAENDPDTLISSLKEMTDEQIVDISNVGIDDEPSLTKYLVQNKPEYFIKLLSIIKDDDERLQVFIKGACSLLSDYHLNDYTKALNTFPEEKRMAANTFVTVDMIKNRQY